MRHAALISIFGALTIVTMALGDGHALANEHVTPGAELERSKRAPDAAVRPALIAWAALPYGARTKGPTSGQFIVAVNGVAPPFADTQPIPGWSGLLSNGNGTYTAMPDNGFGTKGNSSDFVLGVYRVAPKFKTEGDGTTAPGSVKNLGFTAFHDRDGILKNGRGIDLKITADFAHYMSGAGAGADSGIPVDPRIQSARLLTGYDFDIESIARSGDGTFWVGDEFGPFLLHFGTDGTLLEEPVTHPFLKSPNHPNVLSGDATANVGLSRGFESLAYDHRKRLLYAVPEAAPTVDAQRPVPGDERVVEIFEFDPRARKYTGRTFRYQKDGLQTGNEIVIGDMTNLAPDVFVLIERDSEFGAKARVKRLYLVNLRVANGQGILEKRLLADLLHLEDPKDIGGDLPGIDTKTFALPFNSVECVVKLTPKTLGVAIDTNFPGEDGRTKGVPDSTEFIKLRFERKVDWYAPRRP